MTLKLSSRLSQIISVAILVLAAGLRLWGIAEFPPGLHDDEAFHLLNAQAIALGQALPVYITGNNGNEPGFAYLAAVVRWILGPAVAWTGRLAAAWVGIVGVALTLRAGKELFPKTQMGNLAGLAVATLFWHLDLSRFGSQPILAATAAAGVMAALWCGARRGSLWAYVLAGVSLAWGLYSYVLFRVFPLVPLAVGLALLAIYPRQRLALAKGGLIAAGVALLLYAPLGLFFIQHPEWFFNRYSQATGGVLGAGQLAPALWSNTLKTLGGLFFAGDLNWRQNLSGRPALDAAQSLFFLVGCGVCLWRWRRPEYAGLLVWLGVGLLPAIVSAEAPHFGRGVMVTPVLALLMALGLATIWRQLRGHLGRGLVIAAVVLSSLLTGVDFFGRWAHDANLNLAFDADPAQVGRLLRAAPAEAWLYDTRPYYSSWIFEYLLGPAGMSRFRIFDANACWVAPAVAAQGAAYAIDSPAALTALQALYPGGALLPSDGSALPERVYHVPPGQAAQVQPATPRQVDFNGQVRMLGYTLPAQTYKPGGDLSVQVVWQVENTPLAGGKVFIHLWGPLKADGSVIYSQDDLVPCGNSYPTDAWRPGELLIETYRLSLPADMPPGAYTLHSGWYVYANGAAGPRLPAYNDAGQPLGDSVQLETVTLQSP